MARRRTILVFGVLLPLLIVALAIIGSLYVLRSKWFANDLRSRAIAAIERATGARTELGSFQYDWRTLTLELDGLVLHGTEPPGAPPLFRASVLRVGLKIVSLLKRDIDVTSLVVQQPHLYLLFRPDGTTNIPPVKLHHNKTAAETLLDLKIAHFTIDQGTLQTDFHQVPLSARGDNLNATLTFDSARERYGVRLSSHQLHVESTQTLPVAADLDLQADLERNRLTIPQFALQTAKSRVTGNIVLTNFRSPMADAQLSVQADVREVGQISELPELTEGELQIRGAAHYDASSPFTFHGKMSGRNIAYRSRIFSLARISAESDVYADTQLIDLKHLTASVLGSRVVGSASLKQFRRLSVAGQFHALDVNEVVPYLTKQTLPWRGLADGPFSIDGILARRISGFVLKADAEINPAGGGIPLSGNVDVTYRQANQQIELGSSQLILPHSQLTVSGVPEQSLTVSLDSTDLNELKPALPLLGFVNAAVPLSLNNGGSAHFAGIIADPLTNPQIRGELALTRFEARGEAWDQLRGHATLSAAAVQFSGLTLDQGSLHANGSGRIPLAGWDVDPHAPFQLQGQFRGADVARLMNQFSTLKLPIARGVASGSGTVSGSLDKPSGDAKVSVDSLDAYGELLNRIQFSASLKNDDLQVTQGKIQAGPASATFSAGYRRAHGSWDDGVGQLKLDSNGFPLASLSLVRKYEPDLNAQFEVHGQAEFSVVHDQIRPLRADGAATFRSVTLKRISLGSATVSAVTQGQLIEAKVSGDLRSTQLNGSLRVQIADGYPAQGALHLAKIDLGTVYSLAGRSAPLPFAGSFRGDILIDGPLFDFDRIKGSLRVEDVEVDPVIPAEARGSLNSADLVLRNLAPIVVNIENGSAVVHSFQISGKDTRVDVTGAVPLSTRKAIDLRADGSVNLQIFQLADPNVLATGVSTINASIGGTYNQPTLNGTLALKNASFFLTGVTNGLSDVNGTLRFDTNRATIQNLTARSGGGDLALAGFVAFNGGPLVYQLTADANQVRIRYAGGISVTVNSNLRFSGTSEHSLLSGTVTLTKAAFTPSTDIGALLANTAAPAPAPGNEKGFLNGVQFDVRVESSPNLQLSTSLSQDVQAEADIRIRGTPDRPTVLGGVSVNAGDIKIFGTKYTINRGEIQFQNPARIEPVLDLDVQTEAHGITVDITVSGLLSKLNINYRSDPPLQPRDIVALLTVGRAPDTTSNLSASQTTNDFSALQSGANTVLGQAFSPVSNRLSKLFGITNIKIDPLVQGITNTPQARLTVEQQVSKAITITYITNLQETSEQIFRLEWALSSQYSLVALRDDNGEFGVDILFKKRFR